MQYLQFHHMHGMHWKSAYNIQNKQDSISLLNANLIIYVGDSSLRDTTRNIFEYGYYLLLEQGIK